MIFMGTVKSMPKPRQYRPDSNDLDRMTALIQAAWQVHGRIGTNFHVGDLYWQLRYPDYEQDLWLWEDAAENLAGFAMLSRGEKLLEMQLHPDYDDSELEDEILTWAEAQVADCGETDEALMTLIPNSDSRTALLVDHGYVLQVGYYNYHLRQLDEPMEVPSVPEGYTVRHLRGEVEVAKRVQAHRDGWESALLTEESYRRMMQLPSYQTDLDIVVEAPDGSFAATGNCWLDEVNKVGIFEPVSTHPEHRRKGLARALMFYGMNQLREWGANAATVCSASHNPTAKSLYESCGMEIVGLQFAYGKANCKQVKSAPVTNSP